MLELSQRKDSGGRWQFWESEEMSKAASLQQHPARAKELAAREKQLADACVPMLEPPVRWLSEGYEAHLDEWGRFTASLAAEGRLNPAHYPSIVIWVQAWVKLQHWESMVGADVDTAERIIKNQRDVLLKLTKQFGLTPGAQKGLPATGKAGSKGDSEFFGD